MDLYLFTSTLVTLFVILDPPGLLPVFLGLTRRMTRKERNASALHASLVGGGVILLVALFGRQILDYLHVSMPALQVAGGLLLLLVALELLQGKASETTEQGGGKGRKMFGRNFLYVEPELAAYVNVSKYCRLGAGVSYRYFHRAGEAEFSDRDFRGVGGTFSASFGVF